MVQEMTVVAGLADAASNTAIVIADSRVTSSAGLQRFDICQKVALLDNQGVVAFSGPIDTGARICRGITGMYELFGFAWLNSESEVMEFLARGGALEQASPNAFLIGFMDDSRPGMSPKVTVVRFSTRGDYRRTTLGIEMIGTGSTVLDVIRPRLVDLLNFGGPGQSGVAVAQRALFFSHVVAEESRLRRIRSVGGLMQVHFVEQAGVRAVPYTRWVDISDDYGTYVQMDIDEDGAWVQIHEPSGLRIPLRFPDEPDFGATGGSTGSDRELERLLTLDSPGVIRRPNPVQVYRPLLTPSGDWVVRTP